MQLQLQRQPTWWSVDMSIYMRCSMTASIPEDIDDIMDWVFGQTEEKMNSHTCDRFC